VERRWLFFLISHGIGFKSNALRRSKKNVNFSMGDLMEKKGEGSYE
jgi:hypothetical protein